MKRTYRVAKHTQSLHYSNPHVITRSKIFLKRSGKCSRNSKFMKMKKKSTLKNSQSTSHWGFRPFLVVVLNRLKYTSIRHAKVRQTFVRRLFSSCHHVLLTMMFAIPCWFFPFIASWLVKDSTAAPELSNCWKPFRFFLWIPDEEWNPFSEFTRLLRQYNRNERKREKMFIKLSSLTTFQLFEEAMRKW